MIVILCGLASSTALNMFVVPALYTRFHRELLLADVTPQLLAGLHYLGAAACGSRAAAAVPAGAGRL